MDLVGKIAKLVFSATLVVALVCAKAFGYSYPDPMPSVSVTSSSTLILQTPNGTYPGGLTLCTVSGAGNVWLNLNGHPAIVQRGIFIPSGGCLPFSIVTPFKAIYGISDGATTIVTGQGAN